MTWVLLLTGLPGVGKTTIIQKAYDSLAGRGFRVGGMITREVRRGGIRVGFEVEDLPAKRRGWLAQTDQSHGPQVGKCRVNLRDLEKVGVRAIVDATMHADIIVIDEIGPMELCSPAFRDAVTQALDSKRAVLGTIHYRAGGSFISAIRERADVEVVEVTLTNREALPSSVTQKVIEALKREP